MLHIFTSVYTFVHVLQMKLMTVEPSLSSKNFAQFLVAFLDELSILHVLSSKYSLKHREGIFFLQFQI